MSAHKKTIQQYEFEATKVDGRWSKPSYVALHKAKMNAIIANRTLEERRRIALKAWETRRANS